MATGLASLRTGGDRTCCQSATHPLLRPRFLVGTISFFGGIKDAQGIMQPEAASHVPRNSEPDLLVLKTKPNPTRDEDVKVSTRWMTSGSLPLIPLVSPTT